ncbi:Oxysterol-binding protein 9, partial [Tetrabaena socialis]
MNFKRLLKSKKEQHDDGPITSSASSVVEEPVTVVTYHPDADLESGGMSCTNDDLLKQQREAIMQWVRSMGKRLLTGNINLINTPFPVTIFEPRSYLEKLGDVWVYPRYLAAAAAATDPVERMKLVTTWFVAGLHHAFTNWRKPFNPILGETWQATLSDGTSMFMEQISHHPPVSAFHMEGPGGSYRFRGLSQPTVSIVVKYYGFKTVAKGFRYVEFRDGTRIELHYPQYVIKNVVYGASRPRAEVEGQAILVDVRNKLKTVINFGPLKGARNKVLRRADAVYGFIYDCRDNQVRVASLEEKTSTADIAEAMEDARPSNTGARSHSTGSDAHGDDHEFESASENEYDAERDDADTSAALEAAAAEAAGAEAAAAREAGEALG